MSHHHNSAQVMLPTFYHQRKHRRWAPDEMTRAMCEFSGQTTFGEVVDISDGGCLIEGDIQWPLNSVVTCTIFLTGLNMTYRAKVVRHFQNKRYALRFAHSRNQWRYLDCTSCGDEIDAIAPIDAHSPCLCRACSLSFDSSYLTRESTLQLSAAQARKLPTV